MHINGIAELDAKLEKLAENLAPEQTTPILEQGAQIVADSARAKAPIGPTGNLRRGIRATRLQPRGKHTAAIAAVDYRIAPHAHLVEHGTGERIAKRGKHLGWHYGVMPAQPFLGPAALETQEQVVDFVSNEIRAIVEAT
jgi:HK97 gp10 family phage protein